MPNPVSDGANRVLDDSPNLLVGWLLLHDYGAIFCCVWLWCDCAFRADDAPVANQLLTSLNSQTHTAETLITAPTITSPLAPLLSMFCIRSDSQRRI